ncbi:response regulator [Thaumasiovibrio subtropicus]|uniref:response regulator n=1 Tax=Thaumasiovibrio subtropicus TaxID=1891207 RepID=UPI000B34F2FC|nr:response regulator [Thaumasiovibrio subtropicus]
MKYHPKVLIVDDDKSILMLLEHSLNKHFVVTACSAPCDALNLISENEFDIVITDFSMPYMDGITLLTNVEEIQPHCARVLITGDADLDTARRAVNEGHVSAFLTKPWQHAELLAAITAIALDVEKEKAQIKRFHSITSQHQKLEASIQFQRKQVQSAQAQAKKQIKKQQALYQSTITVIHQLIEMRFATKKEHYERISKLAMKFATYMQFTSKQTTTLYLSALMYDIGLLAIEGDIADKNGEASLLGSQLVSAIPGLTDVASTIESLNENYNGSGNPHRLSEDSIPYLARTLRIIRDFDLLQEKADESGNRRKYAFVQLYRNAHSQYDPQIVATFEQFINANLYELDASACLSADELVEGQVVKQAIVGTNEAVLLKSGMTLTAPLISRLKRYEIEHNMRLAVFI